MKPYGSKKATRKYPGSTKPHGRYCSVCYPPDKVVVNKTSARQSEQHEIEEQEIDLEEIADTQCND